MYPNIILILRAVQAVLALIILGLTAYVVNTINNAWLGYGGGYGPINFLLFCSVWSLFIVIPYFIFAPKYFPAAAHLYALLGVEAVTTIFWFAGFIAVAADTALLGNCAGFAPCHSWKASAALGAFEWLAFAVTLGLAIMAFIRNRKSTTSPEVQAQATV
ncbi:hypothetical protein FQN57_003359 [Myotisia sp. PD_48]|nr:hypothetical protein FQN57_003359 [Myotisia sp. PD_48]